GPLNKIAMIRTLMTASIVKTRLVISELKMDKSVFFLGMRLNPFSAEKDRSSPTFLMISYSVSIMLN
ncbi:MAG: hypothetical protein Q8R87_06500, partial [Anaerolineaceae bacterium]|nr:hypothetical protein [Anaerolineaceae bacterium]